MSVRHLHDATDCSQGSTDWTTIGTRILQTAAMAGAIHLAERTRQTRVIGEWLGREQETPAIDRRRTD